MRIAKNGIIIVSFNCANVRIEINNQVSIKLIGPSLRHNLSWPYCCEYYVTVANGLSGRMSKNGRGSEWMDTVFSVRRIKYDRCCSANVTIIRLFYLA